MPDASTACNEVSTVLWRERDVLDGLAFALEVQRLLLLPGHERWLSRACREVEMGLGRLRLAELVRAVRVDTLAHELGLAPSPTLRTLVEAVDEPWTEIFAGHRQAFLDATEEVVRLADSNRERLGARLASSDAPVWLRSDTPASGRPSHHALHPLLGEVP